MNNERRKQIEAARALLEKAQGLIDEAQEELTTARDDEQSYHDDMPENFREGERGQKAEAAAEALGEVVDALDEIDFGDIWSKLDTAGE